MSMRTSFIEIEYRGYRNDLYKELWDLGNAVLENIDRNDLQSITLNSANNKIEFGINYDKDGTGTGRLRCVVWQYDMRGFTNKEDIINREANHHLTTQDPIDPGAFVDFIMTMSDNVLIFLWIYDPDYVAP